MRINFQINPNIANEFADACDYSETIIDPVTKENKPNPLTREMYVEQILKNYVKDKVRKLRQDRNMANTFISDVIL